MSGDLQTALRALRRSPGFTAVAVASLSIGIGAASAIFSFLNAVRLRTLPVRAPHELRLVHWKGRAAHLESYTGDGETDLGGGFRLGGSFPYPAYREFRDRARGFVSLAAFFPMPRMTAFARGEARTTSGLMVSGNFFETYGAGALIGRALTPQDDQPGAAPAAVITYRMWEREFGLDPHALGETLQINRSPFAIVGVLPRGFVGPTLGDMADFYVPMAAQPALVPSRPLDSSNRWWVRVMGRAEPGADETQAAARLAVLFRQVLARSSSRMEQPGIVLQDGSRGANLKLRNRAAAFLMAMLGVVGVVLVIACANVAGLLLARGAARRREMAVRSALGAGRWRLLRQSVVESAVLGVVSAVVGLLLSSWVKAGLLRAFGSGAEGFHYDLRADATVLAATILVGLVTALTFGLVPALRASRVDPCAELRTRTPASGSRLRSGRVLVSVQMGLSVLLLALGLVMARTLVNLARTDPGFDPENVLLFRVDPGKAGYEGRERAAFYAQVRSSVAAIPGVRSVAAASQALAGDGSEVSGIVLDGGAKGVASREVSVLVTTDGFLGTMGIPLLAGRDIAATDTPAGPPVAVVNETFARSFLGGAAPIGRSFLLEDGRGRTFTIVGVARDAKYANVRDAVPPLVILPVEQVERGAMVFAVRSALPPASLVPAARRVLAAIDPQIPLSSVRTQEEVVAQSLSLDRITAWLCGGMAALALALASIGVYGLLAYSVARRTNEMGIRAALGATRRELARSVVGEALRLAGAGLAIGLPLAIGALLLVRGRMFGVAPFDPLTFAGVLAVLLAVAVLASWLPARRASRVEPIEALRCE